MQYSIDCLIDSGHILCFPSNFIPIPIYSEVEANTSLGFFTMVRTIRSIFLVSQKTSCSVNFCDPQRVSKWVGIKGSVCYGMSTNSTSLSMHPTVSIRTENETYQMDVVSSFKFSKLYLRFYIPGLCNLYMLQLTQDSINVFESMEKCMNFINDNGRYTVV